MWPRAKPIRPDDNSNPFPVMAARRNARTPLVALAERGDVVAIGRGYVTFARTHPDLFLLMFRSERLDFTRPVLRSAADAALDVLAGTVRAVRDEPMQAALTLPQAAQMVVAWSLVHGFAMLLLDDRLKQLIAKLPLGVDEMAFLPAILSAALPKT
jgi:hypothetical protein